MLNQSDKNTNQRADWRCAPQPLRFYSREKIAEKMRAARAMYAMRRTLGEASRRGRPVMEAMEREARLARPADAVPVSDGLSALAGLSEKQLREKLLNRSQIVALSGTICGSWRICWRFSMTRPHLCQKSGRSTFGSIWTGAQKRQRCGRIGRWLCSAIFSTKRGNGVIRTMPIPVWA